MLNDILLAADLYGTGLDQVTKRKAQWLQQHTVIKDHLKEVADYLNEKAVYKQQFYVDSRYAYNDATDGKCIEMPSLAFRSGDMSMLACFTPDNGTPKEYTEHGLQITFNPAINGEIHIILFPHYNDLANKVPEPVGLAVIGDIDQLSLPAIDEILARGIKTAFHYSFTGIADAAIEKSKAAEIPHYTPIGFKRYETTQKTY